MAESPAAEPVLTLRSGSPEETRAIGAVLGRRAVPNQVIGLSGDLGTGKTCVIQGIAQGLGIAELITSPTFVLVAEHEGRLRLYHVDLYRTSSLEEIRALGLEEMLEGGGLTVIEWAERAEPLLPSGTIRIHIEGLGDEPRTLTVRGVSAGWLPEGS